MNQSAKWHLTIVMFLICWVLYIGVANLTELRLSSLTADFFGNDAFNLVFLMVVFLFISVCFSDAVEFLYYRVRRLKCFQPKLGEILVNRGFITAQELDRGQRRCAAGCDADTRFLRVQVAFHFHLNIIRSSR